MGPIKGWSYFCAERVNDPQLWWFNPPPLPNCESCRSIVTSPYTTVRRLAKQLSTIHSTTSDCLIFCCGLDVNLLVGCRCCIATRRKEGQQLKGRFM